MIFAARILGCGSSGGVPRVDGDWGTCDPNEPKNRRLRCSLLIETSSNIDAFRAGESTRLVIDTSPDFRQQILDAGAPSIHGLAYTHTHADQCHGIDDVRAIVYRQHEKLPALMSRETKEQLESRFDYIFHSPEGSGYPPLLDTQLVSSGSTGTVDGPGGSMGVTLFDVDHGRMPCSGIRIGPIAYTPDVNGLNDAAKGMLSGVSIWVVDALREKPHPSHAHLDQSLQWLETIKPDIGILTNLHVDMDYRTLTRSLPNNVRPGFDGLSFAYDDQINSVIYIDPV